MGGMMVRHYRMISWGRPCMTRVANNAEAIGQLSPRITQRQFAASMIGVHFVSRIPRSVMEPSTGLSIGLFHGQQRTGHVEWASFPDDGSRRQAE